MRVVISLFSLLTLVLPLAAAAQDDPGSLPGGQQRTRSSPFDPPTEDVFVADVGPGLDTGCTFNTDPEHPLIIDVLIGQAVGEVDANGYLVDPSGLVTAGVVPGSVEVIMPAFDVDVNGTPPPERDEVLLNGQTLGILTGDNGIWKLNSFSVPIGEIKFPAPSPGSCSPPVANRIQINVDTLSTGRWCTAIDWVALVIPIHLKTAIKLEPTAGNKISVRDYSQTATIDTVYEQSFDAGCNLSAVIDDYDEYPLSGPARKLFGLLTGTARLRATLENCPCSVLPASEVVVNWEIGGTSLSGVDSWTGSAGDIDLTMPQEVGEYDVELTFNVDGKDLPPIQRKLFVTRRSPLTGDPPRLGWYEKATGWASGEKDEADILEALLDGLYAFGGANWRYIDPNACHWKELVRDPIACDHANCYVFSDVLENMAAVLGVGGLSPEVPRGSQARGFLTDAAPSLDPAFPGSAKEIGSTTYDRYVFSSHSLRQKSSSTYYDATFGKIYSSANEFITANLTGTLSSDADGTFLETVEGWNVYDLLGTSFYTWGDFAYKAPPRLAPLSAQPAPFDMIGTPRAQTTDIEFTGDVTFDVLDDDLDGLAEALTADVEVQLNAAGEYVIRGRLISGGQLVANRPAWESMSAVRATLDEISGTYSVALVLSGEQIYRSGEDGPYDLELVGIADDGSASATLATPAYDHTLFGEVGAAITGVAETAVDADADGDFDYVEVTVDLDARLTGDFRLQGALDKDGQTVVGTGAGASLPARASQVTLRFDGGKIQSSGIDGPYDGAVNLIDAEGHTIEGITFITAPYTAASFSGLLEPLGAFSDQGIDDNGNGLFDFLRIEFDADIEEAGTYLITGVLRGTGSKAVFSEVELGLGVGPNVIAFDFPGPEIHALELDGPYSVEVVMRDPATLESLAAVQLPQATAGYGYTEFDPFGTSNQPILLTGNSSDLGIDGDGNGLYETLQVDVEVALANSDTYEWSARLEDAGGTEIGFYTDQASLAAGVNSLPFVFAGEPIGTHGADGPYFVRGLLIFGAGGDNLVSVEVAATQAYRATEFEGAEVDLSLALSTSPPIATYGAPLTYILTVTNHGTSASTGAAVTDPLPAGVTFESSADCTEAAGTVTCAIGPLAAGESADVSFEVTVDLGAASLRPDQSTELVNTATVTGNEAVLDPFPDNNNATVTTQVAGPGRPTTPRR